MNQMRAVLQTIQKGFSFVCTAQSAAKIEHGIPKVRFHDLRHTFATIALQNGVDIKTVSSMLAAGFTPDTYAHVTTSAQKEAAQTMGNVLSI